MTDRGAPSTIVTLPVVTPCTGVCRIADDQCLGCARTLDEIAAWSGMTPAERDAVMATLPARRPRSAGA